MPFEAKEEIEIICINCESEYIIKELYTEDTVKFCPYCSAEISVNEQEDD